MEKRIKKKRKVKESKSWVMELIITILIPLFLSENINKVFNFFLLPLAGKTKPVEEMYIVEGGNTAKGGDDGVEIQVEDEETLISPPPAIKVLPNIAKVPSIIKIISVSGIEENNRRLAAKNRFMRVAEGKIPFVTWHHTAMFASDSKTVASIERPLSVPLVVGRDGIVYKLFDFALYSGYHLYQGDQKGQAKLYSNSGDLIAGATTLNRITFGVEIAHGVRWQKGEMDLPDEVVTDAQLRGIANLMVYFWNEFKIGPDRQLTHSELQTWNGEREKEPRNIFFYSDRERAGFSAHPNLIKICNWVKEQGAWNTGEFSQMSGEQIAYAIIHNNVRIGINYLEAMKKEGRSVDERKLKEYYKTFNEYDRYRFNDATLP